MMILVSNVCVLFGGVVNRTRGNIIRKIQLGFTESNCSLIVFLFVHNIRCLAGHERKRVQSWLHSKRTTPGPSSTRLCRDHRVHRAWSRHPLSPGQVLAQPDLPHAPHASLQIARSLRSSRNCRTFIAAVSSRARPPPPQLVGARTVNVCNKERVIARHARLNELYRDLW